MTRNTSLASFSPQHAINQIDVMISMTNCVCKAGSMLCKQDDLLWGWALYALDNSNTCIKKRCLLSRTIKVLDLLKRFNLTDPNYLILLPHRPKGAQKTASWFEQHKIGLFGLTLVSIQITKFTWGSQPGGAFSNRNSGITIALDAGEGEFHFLYGNENFGHKTWLHFHVKVEGTGSSSRGKGIISVKVSEIRNRREKLNNSSGEDGFAMIAQFLEASSFHIPQVA